MMQDASRSVKKESRKAAKPSTCNDIDLENWRQYEHVLTDSLWNFPSRERSGGHSGEYHGNCVPQILTQLLERYTKQGETMVDLFLGSGTSAIEADRMGRNCIGVELQPVMVEHVIEKLTQLGVTSTATVIQADSTDVVWTKKRVKDALKTYDLDLAHFLFLHPPYADIIQFSALEQDLSNAPSTDAFLESFEQTCQLAYSLLEPGRFAAVVIGDKYANSELVPLGFYCMERMNRAGFKTKSIIVKNIAGNERGKGRTNNLWRYRALSGGFYLFKHEYVIVFQKPDKKSSKVR